MSEESAFLSRLREDPLDGLTRSVYADWLEENGDPRSDYLRAEAALAAMPQDCPDRADAEEALERLGQGIDEDWLFQAGAKWELWGLHCPSPRRLPFIREMRLAFHTSLAEAKARAWSLPACLIPRAPFFVVAASKKRFDAITSAPLTAEWAGLDELPIALEFRPATEESVAPGLRAIDKFVQATSPDRFLRLLDVRPDKVISAARVLCGTFTDSLFQAIDWCTGPMPVVLDERSGKPGIREVVSRLNGLATAEVVERDGSSPFQYWQLLLPRWPASQDIPRIRRALARVTGTNELPHHERVPGFTFAHCYPRFRCDEIIARLRGLLDLDLVPI
jgi:uncharacterized protein (TIGR02996 family)